jgi:hypothetical protein
MSSQPSKWPSTIAACPRSIPSAYAFVFPSTPTLIHFGDRRHLDPLLGWSIAMAGGLQASEPRRQRLHLDPARRCRNVPRGAAAVVAPGKPPREHGTIHLRTGRGAARRRTTVAGSLCDRCRLSCKVAEPQAGELRSRQRQIQRHRNVLSSAVEAAGNRGMSY